MFIEYKVYRRVSDLKPFISRVELPSCQMIGKKKFVGKKAKMDGIPTLETLARQTDGYLLLLASLQSNALEGFQGLDRTLSIIHSTDVNLRHFRSFPITFIR